MFGGVVSWQLKIDFMRMYQRVARTHRSPIVVAKLGGSSRKLRPRNLVGKYTPARELESRSSWDLGWRRGGITGRDVAALLRSV